MSNAKAQMSNQIQSSNEMPKQVRHDKNVILNSFQNPFLNFDIPLTFACLREVASAKAGILKFEQIWRRNLTCRTPPPYLVTSIPGGGRSYWLWQDQRDR